jgi:NodT family efflux transporter outer membrane factor (OMF) lipoprotein
MRGAACLLLAGCTVGPDFERPAPWWSPASWGAKSGPARQPPSQTVPEPVDPQWWKLLDDPLLTSLEARLAAANLDVRLASIRIAEARAQLGVVESARFPSINGNASYLRQQQSRDGVLALTASPGAAPGTASNGTGGVGGVPNSSLFKPYDLYEYGFDASWELDFWGRVSRGVESAGAGVTASSESQRDTLVTASAELARDYIQLRAIQRKLAIARENLQSARESLRVTQERAAGGVTTDLDVANAAAQVEDQASQIPVLETQQAQTMNAIAFLLGEQPRAMEVQLAAPRPIPAVPPRVPVGVPSELARRRPDIRRAEAQLHGATADIGVAVADFYPRFTLSGSGAIQALQFSNLADWQAHTFAIGPSVTLPIFEGGRLRQTLEFRKASEQEAAVNYQRTVLAALHEVDDALTAYDQEQLRRARLEAGVVQSTRALSLARQRYEQGVTDFLQVLLAQRTQLVAEQALADSTANVSTNLVQIYKALGGGWQTDLPEAQARL